MKGYFKPAILFIITSLLVVVNGNSQITPKKKGDRKAKIINTPTAPVIIDSYKENEENTNIDLSGAYKITREDQDKKAIDSILNFFIQSQTGIKNFTFIDKKDTSVFTLDNLFLKHKTLLDDFIKRFKRGRDEKNLQYAKAIKYEEIHKRIIDIGKIAYRKRSEAQIKKIFATIDSLQNSFEKVALFLDCADMSVHNDSLYFRDITSYSAKAVVYAKSISDNFQRAIAYRQIGDFADGYQFKAPAIQYYYLARENVENSTAGNKFKYIEQANLCINLANLFYSEFFEPSIRRQINYASEAADLFQRANLISRANYQYIYATSLIIQSWLQFLRNSANSSIDTELLYRLRFLKDWFTKYKDSDQNQSKLIGFHTIGNFIFEKDTKTALIYDLTAFPYACFGSDLGQLRNSIAVIIIAYSALGLKNKALEYADLDLYLTQSIAPGYNYDDAYLEKALLFNQLHVYDSALNYSSLFLKDTARKNFYFPIYYDLLLEKAYKAKYLAFDALGQIDSARKYETFYNYFRASHLEYMTTLVETESEAINAWLTRSKNKEIAIQKKLELTLESNLKLKEALLDSAQSLATKNEKLAIESEGVRKRDSISGVNNIAREKKNTQDQKKLLTEQTNLTEKQKAFKNLVIVGSVIAAIILVSIILFGRSFYRLRIKERESALRVKESEVKRIDELARNKIHNIENDYSEIGVLLNSNQLNKLKLYTEEYESFLAAFLSNWKSDTIITLEDELVATERYCKVKAVLNDNFKYTIEAPQEGKDKIKFLQSVFDTLLDNTVRYNSKKSEAELLFKIQIVREENYIKCIVSDNGTPPSDDSKYLAEENSGLNLLKSRIRNFYLGVNREAPKDFFIVKSKKDKQGTEIQITLPYEEI